MISLKIRVLFINFVKKIFIMSIKLTMAGNYLIAEIQSETGTTIKPFPKLSSFYTNMYNLPIFNGSEFDEQRQEARNSNAQNVDKTTIDFKTVVDAELKLFDNAMIERDRKAMEAITLNLSKLTSDYNFAIEISQDVLTKEIDSIDKEEILAQAKQSKIFLSIDLKNDTFNNVISMTNQMINSEQIFDALNVAYNLETLTQFLQNNTGGNTIQPKML